MSEPLRVLRVLTLNLWNDRGDARRRMEIAVEAIHLLSPHVIGLQEIREAPNRGLANQAATLAQAIGAEHVFAPVSHPPDGPVGNAVVSRLPILRHDAHRLPGPADDPRFVLRTELQTPHGRLVFATTHLTWELEHAARREEQAAALDAVVREWPSELPPVVTGDLNATPDTDVLRYLTGRASLHGTSTYYRDAFARVRPHEDGHTWSSRNAYVPQHIERDRRIDYILVGMQQRDGRGAILDARVVFDMPTDDGAFASDHFGVVAEISLVPAETRLAGD